MKFPDEPNREYIRKFKKRFNMQDKSNAEIKQIIKILNEKDNVENQKFRKFKEGDKVKINLDAIASDINYNRKGAKWKKFAEENADKIFTVEYDSEKDTSIVCFAEDTTDPKWLWYEGHLVRA